MYFACTGTGIYSVYSIFICVYMSNGPHTCTCTCTLASIADSHEEIFVKSVPLLIEERNVVSFKSLRLSSRRMLPARESSTHTAPILSIILRERDEMRCETV